MDKKEYSSIRLEIPESVREKMERLLILDDDIQQVLCAAQAAGGGLYNRKKDIYIYHLQQRQLTFWVEYRPTSDGYYIENVYYHRLAIMES